MSSRFKTLLPASHCSAFERRGWGQFFGVMIQSAREDQGCSVEQAAGRAGMKAADWEAMEAGTVPKSREQLVAIAAALDIDCDVMGCLVLLCGQAWS